MNEPYFEKAWNIFDPILQLRRLVNSKPYKLT